MRTTFDTLQPGQRFRISYLTGPFIRVVERTSDGSNRKTFVGRYNAVSIVGGRWYFTPDQEVSV